MSAKEMIQKSLRLRLLSLFDAKKGDTVKIVNLPVGLARSQFIRFGIMEGDIVKCLERLPGGTILIQKSRQEIAIGIQLAKNIIVTKH
jgi:ferrous iron transport protein A